MSTQPIDVRELLTAIHTQKNVDAELCLDHGCLLKTDDPKPFVKVVNYIINLLTPLANEQLQVGLSLQKEKYSISFLALTETNEFPTLSEKIAEALSIYQATVEHNGEPGKYFQVLLKFPQSP